MHVSTQQNSKLQINQTTMKVLKASSSNFGSLFFMNKKNSAMFPSQTPTYPPTHSNFQWSLSFIFLNPEYDTVEIHDIVVILTNLLNFNPGMYKIYLYLISILNVTIFLLLTIYSF